MRLSHLIIAHTNPSQLKRLINAISNPNADIYIHLDKKTNLNEFSHLSLIPNVFFIKKRCKVTWGAYSMVEATLSSMQQILDTKISYSHINLLSGQDYPVKNAKDITDFFIRNQGVSYMKYRFINEQWTEALPRLNKYDFSNYNFPFKYKLEFIINKIFPKKTLPEGLKPYGLSQWLSIVPIHAKYVIDYLKINKKVRKFFFYTWGADEFVFQTILLNSVHKNYIVNDYFRFIRFQKGAYRPDILNLVDYEEMMKSGNFFARKFDEKIDVEILNYLDKAIK
jgi:Core-2/I-Branching enzyme